jgi:hypothetical protein
MQPNHPALAAAAIVQRAHYDAAVCARFTLPRWTRLCKRMYWCVQQVALNDESANK